MLAILFSNYGFGFFIFISLLISGFVFWRFLKSQGFKQSSIFDFYFLLCLFGLIGGKIPCLFSGEQLSCFLSFSFSWSGAAISLIICLMIITHRWHWDFFAIGKIFIFSSVLLELLISSVLFSFGMLTGTWFDYFNLAYLICTLALIFFVIDNYRFSGKSGLFVGLFAISSFHFVKDFVLGNTSPALLTLEQWGSLILLGYGTLGLYKLLMNKNKPTSNPTLLEKLKKDLSSQEQDLVERKERLEKEDPYLSTQRVEDNAEPADDVIEDLGHEDTATALSFIKKTLLSVRSALYRMRKGKYGVCTSCGGEIPPARLKAIPTTTLCAECAEKKHREQDLEESAVDHKNLRVMRRVS